MTMEIIQEYIDLIIFLILLPLLIFGLRQYIRSKFSKEFEKFKADLENIKLQKLHDLDVLLTRRIKWHEKEQEVLCKLWEKVMKAEKALIESIQVFRFGKIPFASDEMTDEEFEKALISEQDNLSSKDRSKLREAKIKGKDLNKVYEKICDNREMEKVHKAFSEFQIYFNENSIFMRHHIKEEISKIKISIWHAYISQLSNLNPNVDKDYGEKATEIHEKKIDPLIKKLESIIQKELFPDPKDKP